MSGEVGIIVQARMSSSRFPGKSLENIGGKPLIYYVLKRLEFTGLPVIVCTSDHTSDDPLCNYLQSQNFNYYRGSLDNVLDRYINASEEYEIERIVRVTGDNPLVDIDYLRQSLPLLERFDYVDGIYPEGLIKGTGFEFVNLSELKHIASDLEEDREHVTSWLRKNISRSEKRIQLSPNSINKYKRDLFLTCDYPEDLELLKKLFQHFDYRVNVTIEQVVNYIEENPALKDLNKDLH